MASITNHANGRRTIQFVDWNKRRRSIRLGKVSRRQAETVKWRVEQLVAAKITGHAMDGDVANWVRQLDQALADKLAQVELIPARKSALLGPFLEQYIQSRGDVRNSTTLKYENTKRNLISHFGRDRNLRDITAGECDVWRLGLIESGLAKSTISKRIKIAKMFFNSAVRLEIINTNPFADLPTPEQTNREKEFFVTRESAELVLANCPNSQWQLIFALARYGGLRCPSEVLALTWADVDWDRDRIMVSSPKTSQYEGKEHRVIPLFRELRPYLERSFEEAAPGTVHCITKYREKTQNLRTQLLRIIRKAGLAPWDRPFQNLRSTRETELTSTYPLHVVCAWIGNSATVANKHYLQVTEEHFEKALQNPVQQAPAGSRNDSHMQRVEKRKPRKTLKDRDLAAHQVPPQGLEP